MKHFISALTNIRYRAKHSLLPVEYFSSASQTWRPATGLTINHIEESFPDSLLEPLQTHHVIGNEVQFHDPIFGWTPSLFQPHEI